MPSEDNKALVRRFVDEVQSAGNTDLIDEICSPEFVNHSPPPGIPADCEGIKIVTAMFRGAFPDSHFTIEDMVAEGDKVVIRVGISATHKGELLGIPPTENRLTLSAIELYRLAEGKIDEQWVQVDTLGMMQQLGVVPTRRQ